MDPPLKVFLTSFMSLERIAFSSRGLLLATPLADIAGVRAWYLAAGVVSAALGMAAFLVRSIVQMEEAGTPTSSTQETRLSVG